MRFLEDAHRRGVQRQTGARYESDRQFTDLFDVHEHPFDPEELPARLLLDLT